MLWVEIVQFVIFFFKENLLIEISSFLLFFPDLYETMVSKFDRRNSVSIILGSKTSPKLAKMASKSHLEGSCKRKETILKSAVFLWFLQHFWSTRPPKSVPRRPRYLPSCLRMTNRRLSKNGSHF